MYCYDIDKYERIQILGFGGDMVNVTSKSQVFLGIVMTLTSMKGFRPWDLDETSTFVSEPLSEGETVYMEEIPGFPLPKGK